jgi:hypothetical protein
MGRRTAKADVTPVRQRTQYSCMSTSMMMCLQALGYDVDEDEVNKVMGARPMKGASWEQALACAQHYGVRATLTTPSTVKQLKEWTDAGKPVMIAWNPEGREWSHASVVFDVDDDLNVYVADPNIPDPDETVRMLPKGEFYKKWYEKWPNYLVRRPALMLDREITPDGKQVMASTKASPTRIATAHLIKKAMHPFLGDKDHSLWSGRGKPSREELKEIEGMQWQDWTPQPLPEGLSRYFKAAPGAIEVPLGKLTPIRAREKGVANANRFMWLAYWGAKDRRKPISLRKNRDGTYTVLDGNSTFANAKMSGWKNLLGVVAEAE